MILSALIGLAAVALYAWQMGIHPTQDGARYTSGSTQPSPFHRRFHHWPPRLLMVTSWISVLAICVMLGTPARAAMFASLLGAMTMVTWPTTVDGPSMALAYASALLTPAHPWAGVALSCAAGAVHERGPVFASIYSWSPWPLLGLLAVQWWAKKGAANHASADLADRLVGHKGTLATALAHRPHVDLLGEGGLLWALRGIVPLAAWQGVPVQGWAALAVAYGSRLVGTDTARCLVWAAPALLMHMDPPWWAVALHVMSFRRCLR